MILARHMGSTMDIGDVRVESLVPRRLARGPFSGRFFRLLAAQDAEMERRLRGAQSHGTVLR
jgi:hypothetical protein